MSRPEVFLATCPDCGGTTSRGCGLCGGSGESVSGPVGGGNCSRCGGKGELPCATCEGSGEKKVTHLVVALVCPHCDDDIWIARSERSQTVQAWIDRHATCGDRAKALDELEARNRAACRICGLTVCYHCPECGQEVVEHAPGCRSDPNRSVDETLPPTPADELRRLA